MLGIEVDGYSHEFLKSMKGWSKENRMNNWDCCFEIAMNRFKGYGKCDTDYEFYILNDEKHTPAPQEGS
jgi:hypothetical protein